MKINNTEEICSVQNMNECVGYHIIRVAACSRPELLLFSVSPKLNQMWNEHVLFFLVVVGCVLCGRRRGG